MVPVRSGAAPLHPTPPSAARLNQALCFHTNSVSKMKEKKKFFKDLNPFLAMILAMFSGLSSLYFGSKLIPIFIEVSDLINQGVEINATGIKVIIFLSIYGLLTYLLALVFQLSQKTSN